MWLQRMFIFWNYHLNRFLVRVSYLEIYNEEVRDLLAKDQSQHLDVKERPDIGVYVKDLSSVVCHSADDMERIMTLGNRNRSTGATNMNEHSSRSHAIFSITIECSDRGPDNEPRLRAGKLHLVDLAVCFCLFNFLKAFLILFFNDSLSRVASASRKPVRLVYDLKKRQKSICPCPPWAMSYQHWSMAKALTYPTVIRSLHVCYKTHLVETRKQLW